MAGESFRDMHVLRPNIELQGNAKLQPQPDETTRKLFAAASPGIVKIETEKARGSGFFVDKEGRVVTDAHCVQDAREAHVILPGGQRYRARIEKLDDINDLAVLKLEGHKTPLSAKVLDLGTSSQLKPDQPMYALGHPLGLDKIYISPGYFRAMETERSFVKYLGEKEVKKMEAAAARMTPKEKEDALAALNRPLIHGRVHVEHGNSGGPILDADGKVVGVTDLGEPGKDSLAYFTPVEKVKAMLDPKNEKFEFSYTYTAEPWANGYAWQWRHAAPAAILETSVAGLAAHTAYSKLPKVASLAVGAYGLSHLTRDFDRWHHSNSTGDSWKFGIATLSDLAMTAGAVARFIPATKGYAALAMSVGILGHLGSDFIPSRLVLTDIRRKDGELRPPHSLDSIFGESARERLLKEIKLPN